MSEKSGIKDQEWLTGSFQCRIKWSLRVWVCLSADRRAEKGIITIYRFPSDVSEDQTRRGSQEWAEIYKGIIDEESEEE